MKKLAALTTAVMMSVAMVGLAAQAKPNFAGKWTMVVDQAAAAAPAGGGGGRAGGGGGGRGGGFGGGGFCGMECTITQDATTLVVTRTTQAGETKTNYKLDGTESKNEQNFGGNAIVSTSKAMFEGAKLTIATTRDMGGTPATTKMTLSMDATGQLVVETTAPGRNGGEPTTTKQTFKK